MMMPGKSNHELLGWTPERLSTVYYDEDATVEVPAENELILFNDLKGLAIQWHPEGMDVNSEANKFVKSQLERTLFHGA